MTLVQATNIVVGALGYARQLGCQPMTVAVLDPGGHMIAMQREDESGILRPQIASAKAWGALGMGFGTRELHRRAEQSPAFVSALTAVSHGQVVPVPGGVLVRDPAGELLGAVGISGDTSDRDEACARHAIEEAGLRADTGA